MNSADIKENPYPKILLVGDGGTHKTRFLGDVPGNYIFDFDAGMAINRDRSVEYDTIKDVPKGSKVTNPQKGLYPYGTAWAQFIRKLNEKGELIDKGKGPQAISCDSLTTLSSTCMNAILKNDDERESPAIHNWGAQISYMERIMDQLTSWPVIFIATAHIQRNTNNVTEVVEQLPLLTGKLAGKIGIYFDEVWYCQVSGVGANKKFTLATESQGLIKQAKSRYGVPTGTETSWAAVKKYFGL